jgi:uncharacterized SAM-binding protein YcdF (DUF218 family)
MIHGMQEQSSSMRRLYGTGLAMLLFVVLWWGLRYLVSHATGSIEPHLAADIVVPLAQSAERTAYAQMLVRQSRATHVGSTLVDTHCLRVHGASPSCATGVRNTIDEAIHLRHQFEEDGVTRAIVVTSFHHLARAAAVFAIIFAGTGIHVQVVAAPGDDPSQEHVTHEVKSYLPSLAAAVLARFAPTAYEWSLRSFRGSGLQQGAYRPST